MKKFIFLFSIITAIISCKKQASIVQPGDKPFYKSLWKMTIKSDTADIVIDSLQFSSSYHTFSSPDSILFLNNFHKILSQSHPDSAFAFYFTGGWLFNTQPAPPDNFQLALLLQSADTTTNRLEIGIDTAYFDMNTDSTVLSSTRIVNSPLFFYGQGYHTMNFIQLDRRR
ncbi:MAG: hypothetical protein JWN78_13 [Bacteroidota bacterium]|nr:hypothetical protein [Bacteroidota bacterium]